MPRPTLPAALQKSLQSEKESKYSLLFPDYIFQPVAFETLGSLNCSGFDFLCEVGRRLSVVSGDPRDLFPIPASVYFDSALQLCPHSRVLLFQRRRPGPLATMIFVFSFVFSPRDSYT